MSNNSVRIGGWRRAAGVVAAVETAGMLFLGYALVDEFGATEPLRTIVPALGGLAAAAISFATAVTLLRRREPGRAGRTWALLAWAVHLAVFVLLSVLLVPIGGWRSALELGIPVLVLWAVLAVGTVRIIVPAHRAAPVPAVIAAEPN